MCAASGLHFLQLIEIVEGREEKKKRRKKNLNYITAADQPTDSRPPEATSATSTNIDRVPISFLHFIINMKLVLHKSTPSPITVKTPYSHRRSVLFSFFFCIRF